MILFIIFSEIALSLPPCVRGILLPNNQEVANVWFVDDTSILLYLEETNMTYLMEKLDTFCLASGSKISLSKSIMLGWTKEPPIWWSKFDLAWGGSYHLVRYLGIPFSVEPNLNLMWDWAFERISRKLAKWNSNLLSFLGRFQVFQKILSSYPIYFSSM